MFTGIITALGQLLRRPSTEGGLELTIASPYADLQPGESIAVDGGMELRRHPDLTSMLVETQGEQALTIVGRDSQN